MFPPTRRYLLNEWQMGEKSIKKVINSVAVYALFLLSLRTFDGHNVGQSLDGHLKNFTDLRTAKKYKFTYIM